MVSDEGHRPSPRRPSHEDATTQLDLGGKTVHRVADERRAFVVVRRGAELDVLPVEEGAELVIGRSSDADVVVDDTRVSRKNTVIGLRDGRLFVRDLGGRNGTRVGKQVLRAATMELARDDEVSVGPLALVVAALAPAREPWVLPGTADEEEAVVVADPKMVELFDLTRRLARAPTTVLIVGETGVGKEIVAEQLHRQSARRSGPFVRLNCAAVPESLVEGELFGHEKGAFTGAHESRAGHFEAASGGTLLLDEVGDLPLNVQPKLLRVLESKRVQRLGSRQERPVDSRVVCATHRDLEAAVRAGTFRSDLYHRIAGFKLAIPPLRDRPKEIRPLCELFATRFAKQIGQGPPHFSESAWGALEAYPWPGNIRQLRNAVEHATILAAGAPIEVEHLPADLHRSSPAGTLDADVGTRMREQVDDAERRAITDALAQAGGNRARAAELLGVSKRTLQYRIAKYGMKG